MGAAEIRAEASIAKTLTRLRPLHAANDDAAAAAAPDLTDGFIRTEAVTVCRGPYAPELLASWRAFDEEKGSENECPVRRHVFEIFL